MKKDPVMVSLGARLIQVTSKEILQFYFHMLLSLNETLLYVVLSDHL